MDLRDSVSRLTDTHFKGFLAFLALFILPYFLMIAYFSFYDRDVMYLRGDSPQWILNQEELPFNNDFPTDFPAIYSVEFDLKSAPQWTFFKLTVARSYILNINGVALTSLEETEKLNWKDMQKFDIAPYVKEGHNKIEVYARNRWGRTALRAEGEVQLDNGIQIYLDSGTNWEVRSLKPYAPLNIDGSPQEPQVLVSQDLEDRIERESFWPGALLFFGGSIFLVIAMFCVPGLFRKTDSLLDRLAPPSLGDERIKSYLYAGSVALIFAVFGTTLINNMFNYDLIHSGDYEPYKQYLDHFLTTWDIPLASGGFQMYNPPFYYLISAALFRLFGPVGPMLDVVRYGQLINTLSTFGSAVLLFMIISRTIKDRLVHIVTLAVATTIPVILYKAPGLSGENTMMFLCIMSFYFWMRHIEKQNIWFLTAVGVFSGLAFLTRYSALINILGICSGFSYAYIRYPETRGRRAKELVYYCSIILAIAGWFYFRNLMHFNRFFPVAGQHDLFFFRQLPGFRNWDFYTALTPLLTDDPITKADVLESFLAGSYTTLWFDGQSSFLPNAFQNFQAAYLAIALALFPSALAVTGSIRTLNDVFTRRADPWAEIFSFTMVAIVALSWSSFTLISYTAPIYSVIKSSHLLFAFVPMVYLLARGLDGCFKRCGRVFASAWLLFLSGLYVYIFFLRY
ncbi:MAG TPA: glycosyltransferase family 39 protein [Nitrospirota bacterium]|jgi:4-amino-4-deoxy-L-arabinose transferase-like glycosyltransferase